MPNKNSIESEIDLALEEVPHLNRPEVYCRGKYGDSKSCDCYVSEIKQKLKNLIQREVKKGRVEEVRKFKKVSGDSVKQYAIYRLEELEG